MAGFGVAGYALAIAGLHALLQAAGRLGQARTTSA
jgi:hypothetical protein